MNHEADFTHTGHETGGAAFNGPGSRLGPYTLLEPLGRGGMGQVWKARDSHGGRMVAIKMLPPEFLGNQEATEQIRSAFAAVHELSHPHLGAVLNLFHDDRHGLYLVMHFVPGETLSQYRRKHLESRGPVPLETVVSLLRPVALALDYAHAEGVIHRDVKPPNILVAGDNFRILRVKLIDFGIAAEIRSTMTKMSVSSKGQGTLPYMSPEQVRGKVKEIDGRSDQYSLGVVAYELLAGHLPFAADNEFALIHSILNDPADKIDGQSAAINSVILRVLSKSKTDRFPSCEALVEALSGRPAVASSAVSPVEASRPPIIASPKLAMGTKAGETTRLKLDEIEIPLVWCPAGRFKMGSPESEPQRGFLNENQVDVEITRGFWLGQTPITQQLYEHVMQENPSHFQGHPQRPVESVDWTTATRFCNQLSELLRGRDQLPQGVHFSLPTEAQWEYACRAGTTTAYSFGHLVSHLTQYGWFDGNAAGTTHEVAQKHPNPWGLFDMHGNIFEWCSDWYVEKLSGGQDPSGASSGSNRVLRGGSWFSRASFCRSAYRFRDSPDYRYYDLGFRVAVVPSSK